MVRQENNPIYRYWQILRVLLARSVRAFFSDNCLNLSAAVAFYSIISVVPILFLIFYASGILLGSSEQAYAAVVEFVQELHPYVEETLIYEIKKLSEVSGFSGWLAIAFLLWISTMLVTSLESSFAVIFKVEDRRHPFRSIVMGFAVIPVGLIGILFSIVVSSVTRYLSEWKFATVVLTSPLVKYIIPLSVTVVFFTLVYRVVPNKRVSFLNALIGGLTCTVLLEIAKFLFNLYLSLGGNPAGFVYGSLKALVYVVIWVFYLATLILFTGEIVSELEKRKELLTAS